MPAIRPRPLGQQWKRRLDLTTRAAPELYEDAAAVTDTPHARAIRTTFQDLRASAVFCTHDVPAVVILSVEAYDRSAVIDLHAKLWNQGLAHLLLVLAGDTLRAFSLARIPRRGNDEDFDDRCLAWELDAVAQALEVNDLLRGAESGRLWEHPKFRPDERIDRVLLDNLKESHTRLLRGMTSAAAQALLIQSMFIYLEDRQIVSPDYLRAATDGCADSFLAILKSGNAAALDRLFERLRDDFNGDLFVAPCSFAAADRHPPPEPPHLEILSRFRSGEQEMGSGQYRFWGYDFKYMPIELISAVYDRFLGDLGPERQRRGAYYTPRFVADLVISQIADKLPNEKIPDLRFLDPACGSGIFLVRCFQLLCEQRRRATEPSQRIPWESLLAMLSRLKGWDIDEAAVRVAVFSLYVALLEEVEPPDIRALIERGNLLPGLWERTLRARDFFTVDPDDPGAQAVFAEIDRLAYDFFGLTDEEIILVEDTVAHVIPAVHPSRNSVPEVWRSSTAEDRRRYAQALLGRMSDWFEDDYMVAARLEAHNEDLAILRLTLQRKHEAAEYHEVESSPVNHVLADLSAQVRRPLAGNFQLLPDFRLVTGDHLYLVKPAQKRFWLRSAAIADADAIALDLQESLIRNNREVGFVGVSRSTVTPPSAEGIRE